MPFNSAFLNSIILLGAIQGFIICGLLLFTGKQVPSNKLLSAIIFLLALACLKIYLNNQGMESNQIGSVISAIFPFIIIMPVGPLIYFYTQSCLNPEFRLKRRDKIHFFPILIDLFQHFAAILFIICLITGIFKSNFFNFGSFIDAYNTYSDVPRWLSLSIYLYFSYRYIISLKKNGKSTSTREYKWLKQFLVTFVVFDVTWLIFLLPYLTPRYSSTLLDWLNWYPIYLPLVILIYWLGIKGYLLNYTYITAAIKKTASLKSISEEVIAGVIASLRRSMEEEKLYLNPELSLDKLAKHIGIHPKTVSIILNQHLHKSFNDFINEYRVQEIKERLLKTETQKLTIVGLAFECGFNSQPTFQRAFKNIIGVTPKEFQSRNIL